MTYFLGRDIAVGLTTEQPHYALELDSGDLKISGTLTIQEQGSVSGNIEYENLQVKLGGQISGDIKVTKTKKDDPKPIDDFNEDFDE